MRWELIKAAWSLASEAFPEKRIYVVAPYRIAPEGAMGVIDLADGKEAGKIAYRVTPSGRVTLAAGGKSKEVSLPPPPRISYKVRKSPRSPNEIQHGIAKTAGAVRAKYNPYEKVRIIDPRSMEFGELGQVLLSASKKGRRFYLISVDGSGKPMWFAEESIGSNMVGALIYRS